MLVNGLGPWPAGFVLIRGFGHEQVVYSSQQKRMGFPREIILPKTLRNDKFYNTVCFQRAGVFCNGKPIGNPWHLVMVGLCGSAVGIGSCTRLRRMRNA